jgi:hypothetical protein
LWRRYASVVMTQNAAISTLFPQDAEEWSATAGGDFSRRHSKWIIAMMCQLSCVICAVGAVVQAEIQLTTHSLKPTGFVSSTISSTACV